VIISPYLLSIVLAWLTAQGGKLFIYSIRNKVPISYRQLYVSGSMPSSHSAAVVALMSVVGMREGVDSAIFGVITLFAAIVMYDALMVRRSSGEQGEALSLLIKEQKSKILLPRAAKGHQPLEVAVGALLGMVIGFGVYFFTK
jgi:uncharacterized protein|tara:strand:+ start:6694 stop:7122 length:429 start_codon:yes stop_codon:yes gene_type:complete